MKNRFECPVCRRHEWAEIESYDLSVRDSPTFSARRRKVELGMIAARILFLARPATKKIKRRFLSRGERIRQEIYRDTWKGDETLTSVLCESCGFVCYAPRPTTEDVAAKYNRLKEYNPSIGGQDLGDQKIIKMDRDRSYVLYQKLSSHMPDGAVLDYGGGNGKLMHAFLEHGRSCYLADYSEKQLPGVNKIADDISSLEGTYSAIVLSHVLEHVAEPGELVAGLHRHLKDDGVLYAEIPIDMLGGLRLEGDPVTHINFFTYDSLGSLLNHNGYIIIDGQTEFGTYGKQELEVAWVVAKKGSEDPTYKPESAKKLLWPSRPYAFRKLLVEARKG
ncbi:class I SAM-dependent methyltransferase [Aquisalimonas sp. 2447]|uniref:class I SAM-dependent methyltransferase n=1 Tax=Aquisalimonas sp. 2447 TaxID=2740807 RepID=UPI0014326F57|nr:class I SAM-dependent methyltransferase [Aquisalimonas sp. 2447]QIT56903.1 class I SAM-dependent methyltransferase [Aquisalimonas sp. 2447]